MKVRSYWDIEHAVWAAANAKFENRLILAQAIAREMELSENTAYQRVRRAEQSGRPMSGDLLVALAKVCGLKIEVKK